MPDPIEVENRFQMLRYHIESTESVRSRYRLLRDFLYYLDGDYKRYETYILQMVEEVPVYVGPILWSGLDPELLESDIDFLESISEELKTLKKNKNYSDLLRRLKEVVILLHCCLNKPQEAKKYLHKIIDHQIVKEIDIESHLSKERACFSSLKDLLTDISKRMYQLSEEEKISVSRLLKQIHIIVNKESEKVLVPVVELYTDAEYTGEYGRLRRLWIEIHGQTKGEDELFQNFRIYGAEKPVNEYDKQVLTAARKLFSSQVSNMRNSFWKGGVSFELTGAIHHGSSANLAISALWYIKLLEAANQRERFTLNPNAVITGSIDEEGNILPVNQTSINPKAKAAFFSWAEYLVVPESQGHLFQEELDNLHSKYHEKNIELIPVSHLKDLFFDRRITNRKTISWLKQIYIKASHHMVTIVWILLTVLLLLLLDLLT